MKLKELNSYLNNLLEINSIKDYSLNGIQIGNENNEVKKIAVAVDSNLLTIQKAVALKVDLLLVHHGFFWDKPFAFTGPEYSKIENLIKNHIALYAIHLPLDINNPYGNNFQISTLLNLQNIEPFGNYQGTNIGYQGIINDNLDQLKNKCEKMSKSVRYFIFNEKKYKKIGIVSGKGGFDTINDFINSDLDLLITGEIEHSIYNLILDWQVNVISLGHYESEKYGVMALAQHLTEKFNIEAHFIEQKTGG